MKYKITFFLTILLIFHGCKSNSDENFKTENINFDEVINYSLNKDWDNTVNWLVNFLNNAKTEEGLIYGTDHLLLLKMNYPNLNIKESLKPLLAENTITEDFINGLNSLQKQFPLSINWNKNFSYLKWNKTYFNNDLQPIIEVIVNGKKLKMLLDTGASKTFIFKDKAQSIDLNNISIGNVDKIQIEGANKTRNTATYSIVDSLNIGSLEIKNNLILIPNRPINFSHIDGIIGWDILSKIKITFNYKDGYVTLSPSDNILAEKPNFLWCYMPMIKVNDNQNRELYFIFDTGSVYSLFNKTCINKLTIEIKPWGFTKINTVGGFQFISKNKIKEIQLYIDNKNVTYQNHINIETKLSGYNIEDGLIGMDLGKKGVITLDYPSGRFSFEPY